METFKKWIIGITWVMMAVYILQNVFRGMLPKRSTSAVPTSLVGETVLITDHPRPRRVTIELTAPEGYLPEDSQTFPLDQLDPALLTHDPNATAPKYYHILPEDEKNTTVECTGPFTRAGVPFDCVSGLEWGQEPTEWPTAWDNLTEADLTNPNRPILFKDIPIIVISAPGSPRKHEIMARTLHEMGLQGRFVFYPALMPNLGVRETCRIWAQRRDCNVTDRCPTNNLGSKEGLGTLGVLLSHLEVYGYIAKRGWPAALVLEDDVRLQYSVETKKPFNPDLRAWFKTAQGVWFPRTRCMFGTPATLIRGRAAKCLWAHRNEILHRASPIDLVLHMGTVRQCAAKHKLLFRCRGHLAYPFVHMAMKREESEKWRLNCASNGTKIRRNMMYCQRDGSVKKGDIG